MPEIWPVLFCHNQKGKMQEKSLILRKDSEFNCVCVCALSITQSVPPLSDPLDCILPAPLPMGLSRSRQEYWSGLSSPPLPDPGIELSVLCLLHW